MNLKQFAVYPTDLATARITNPGLYVYTGAGAGSWTIRPRVGSTVNTKVDPAIFWVKNRGGANLVINRSGSDEFYDSAAASTLTLAAGESAFIADDGTYWVVLR